MTDYMFLIYGPGAGAPPQTEEQRRQSITQNWAIIDEATARGVLKGVSPLEPVAAAKTARVAGDAPAVTDGPFAETREVLAGFYLIACASAEEAEGWAKRVAAASCGRCSIEFRPLRPLPARVQPEPAAANV